MENTLHIFDLYQFLFPQKKDLLEAFGIPEEAFRGAAYDMNTLVESIRSGVDFVKEFGLNVVHRTILLDCPSYIPALAMGQAK